MIPPLIAPKKEVIKFTIMKLKILLLVTTEFMHQAKRSNLTKIKKSFTL